MKIGIAMSGGVDSTACALLLREGYQITGFFMELAQPDVEQQRQKALSIARRLGINLHCVNLSQEFARLVLKYFSKTYHRGQTPNPCVICNQTIKFGLLQSAIIDSGMDMMATGHYARRSEDGRSLFKALDHSKDQSYFLCRLSQQELADVMFPLGEKRKKDVYRFVEEQGFLDFRGTESQDVCFLSNTTVGDYLKNVCELSGKPGAIVTRDGNKLGKHQGLYRYTIGQRRGLGIAAETPLYVLSLDTHRNQLIVGKEGELYKNCIDVDELHWVSGKPAQFFDFTVKIRSTHCGAAATLTIKGTRGQILLDTPQKAVTPGQYAVFYHGDQLLGSGVIQDEKNSPSTAPSSQE